MCADTVLGSLCEDYGRLGTAFGGMHTVHREISLFGSCINGYLKVAVTYMLTRTPHFAAAAQKVSRATGGGASVT
ncbi:hypothetical protein EVAR_40193_1 [Eumeta japonica]|uniref:Uncharacterized protein n=1 Tax=Eumeta variegata TaxID=151549 RepID=A0A4C1XLR0_EUMVA|nr:hypothetical protein EVAR_40193_1 [Eumeta japonica]